MSAVGDVLAGRYRLREHLGSGAMGVVWLAMDEHLHRSVAVKQLLAQPGLDDARAELARQRAMREGRIAARLHHPHAITVYDVAVDDGLPVLVMEYLPSRSLADVIAGHGRIDPSVAAGIGAQAASALTAAHAAGIVHRDIKPGNLLIAANSTTKITDFGISRATGDVALTQTGMFAGTPAYLAPEIAKGHRPTPAADVFSLGATLYAAVEGIPPFGEDAENPLALLHVVAAGKIPVPRNAGPLTPVLAGMLQADPAERLTADQAAASLHAVATGRPLPMGIGQAAAPWSDRTAGDAPTSVVPPAAGFGGPSGTLLDNRPLDSAAVARRPWWRRGYLAVAAFGAALVAVLLAALLSSGEDATGRPTQRQPTASEMEQAVAAYYSLLPDQPERAWTRLGPDLRAEGEGEYVSSWDGIAATRVISRPRATGDSTVHIGVELVEDNGTKIREFHQFGVLADGESLLLNSDDLLHSERITPPPPPEPPKDEEKDDDKDEDDDKGGEDRKGEEDKKGETEKKGERG